MISRKIKSIREILEIPETQISNIIYVSSYRYKRSEIDDAYITTEMLILLSIAYKIPFEKLLLDKYSVEEILSEESLNNFKKLEKEQIEFALKHNICSYNSKIRKKANSSTIDMIIKNERAGFHNNLKHIREEHNYNFSQMAKILEIETEEYINLETRATLPNPTQLKSFLKKLNISVSDLIISAK